MRTRECREKERKNMKKTERKKIRNKEERKNERKKINIENDKIIKENWSKDKKK